MNIGLVSSSLVMQSSPLKPSELNSVGVSDVSEDSASARPVPSIEAVSATNAARDSDDQPSNPNTLESEASLSDERTAEDEKEAAKLALEQQQIQDLSSRDREVRAHEQAHAAVGGQYAGAPKYQFERGPDGVNYAVGGEVPIDVSRAATPEETIRKMQVVQRAALAPAEPSPQDRSVAAQAAATQAQARQEMSVENREASEPAVSEDTPIAEAQKQERDQSAFRVSAASGNSIDNRAPERESLNPINTAPELVVSSSIASQLQRSILASENRFGPGQIINQLA